MVLGMLRLQINKNQPAFAILELIILCFIVLVFLIVSLTSYLSARVKTRDSQRLADIKQIQTALKVFYTDNGFYPETSSFGEPKGITDYIKYWPIAPTPTDGSCDQSQNQYTYSPRASGESFEVQFCLGKSLGTFKAGQHILDPNGIN